MARGLSSLFPPDRGRLCQEERMVIDEARPIVVQIIAAPVACADGFQERWREVASLVAGQLERHFGSTVEVKYFDLFDPTCPPLPPGVELPVVLVAGEVLSSGGKISVPLIRKRIETVKQVAGSPEGPLAGKHGS
jgi:hypothetical protein